MATPNNTVSLKPPSPTSPKPTTPVPSDDATRPVNQEIATEIAPPPPIAFEDLPKPVGVSTPNPERKNSKGETGSTSKRKTSPEISTVQPSKRAHITQCKAKITQVEKKPEGQLVYKHAESIEYQQMIMDRLDIVIRQQAEINTQISRMSTNISKISRLLLSRLQQQH